MTTLEVVLLTLTLLFVTTTGISLFMFYRLYKKFIDVESFVINLNTNINDFKTYIDNLTKSNIMIYDEMVFDVMNSCKNLKNTIDSFLQKYDEYGQYIYTEYVPEEEKKQYVFPILKAGPDRSSYEAKR